MLDTIGQKGDGISINRNDLAEDCRIPAVTIIIRILVFRQDGFIQMPFPELNSLVLPGERQ
jgi:hypothetical protein